MQKYSDFFKTLHDEQGPTGYLGRGTHYSVLRAIVFEGAPEKSPIAQFADFAVIWDEDHDDRVIEPIEKIYRRGLLPFFRMFGERKGQFTAVLADDVQPKYYDEQQKGALRAELHKRLSEITERLDTGDPWPARVSSIESPGPIIDASADKATLYLKSLTMLWELGVKPPSIDETLFNPEFLGKIENLQLFHRVVSWLSDAGFVYIGDLVQKTYVEMLRTPNLGPKGIDLIGLSLAQMGLKFGMEAPRWRPKNIESLAKDFADRNPSTATR